jgi:hypothetical protein
MTLLISNNFGTLTDGAISDSDMSITVLDASGLPAIGGGDTCYLTLQNSTDIEIVLADDVTGDVISIAERGSQGTAAIAWDDSSSISLRLTAENVNSKAATADITELAQDAVGAMVDSTLVYTDGTPLLSRAALTGDVTAIAGSNTTTIANDAVTYAKMQNVSATDKLLGRSTSGAGDVEEIACTAAGRALIDDADAANQRVTLSGYAAIATAAGTTTLTVSSAQTQIFTGSTTQTCVLPVVSTLPLGTIYKITNLSSGVVTVQSSGANTIQAMQANSTLIVISNATSGTSAAVWYIIDYTSAASGQTGSGSLVRATSPTLVTPALGTPTSGALTNCTSIPVANATGVLPAANGGTGVSISPLCVVTYTGTQNISNNTNTKMQLNSESIDNNNNYDNATNYRFTPTVAGTYLCIVSVNYDNPTDLSLLTANIWKNGSLAPGGGSRTGASGTGPQITTTFAIVTMNGSTDYIEAYAYQSSGSTMTVSGPFSVLICARILP